MRNALEVTLVTPKDSRRGLLMEVIFEKFAISRVLNISKGD